MAARWWPGGPTRNRLLNSCGSVAHIPLPAHNPIILMIMKWLQYLFYNPT
jgi:hypothetical protein